MDSRAKQIFDKSKKVKFREIPELGSLDDLHPYNGEGFFDEDGQIREGMIDSHKRTWYYKDRHNGE